MGSLVRERSTMRILPSLLLGLSTAQDESDFKVIEQTWDDVNKVDIWHDVEESEANLGDDVFYTPCQAQRYNAKGFNITNDLILPGSGYDPPFQVRSCKTCRAGRTTSPVASTRW